MKYQFEDFVLDTDARLLLRGGQAVHVERQVFDVLRVLIENRNRLLSKDDLIDRVWRGRIVSDAAIATRINGARRAVGDDGKRQAVIRTQARSGFQFVAEVTEVEPVDADPAGRSAQIPDPAAPPSLAVLPFVNLQTGTNDDLLGQGLAEEITAALSKTRWLFLISPGSSATFSGPAPNPVAAATDLGVRYVLRGAFLKADERIRLTATLLDGETGQYLKVFKVDRAFADLFTIIDALAAYVIGELLPEISLRELARARRKPPDDLGAWELYLSAQDLLRRNTWATCQEAARLLDLSTSRNPHFAPAHARRATALIHEGYYGWSDRPVADLAAEAIEHAQRARAADRDEALAYDALASAHQLVGHTDEAARLARQAIALSPTCIPAYGTLITTLAFQGEAAEAIRLFDRMTRISPRDPDVSSALMGLCIARFIARDLEAAARAAREHAVLRPNWYGNHVFLAAALGHIGDDAGARRSVARLRELLPNLTLASMRARTHLQRPEHVDFLIDGLRAAGLPEA